MGCSPLGSTATDTQTHRIVFRTWFALAAAQQAAAERQGLNGALDGEGDCADYPPAIQQLAAKLA
jgi:hypothetical protein